MVTSSSVRLICTHCDSDVTVRSTRVVVSACLNRELSPCISFKCPVCSHIDYQEITGDQYSQLLRTTARRVEFSIPHIEPATPEPITEDEVQMFIQSLHSLDRPFDI